MSQSEQPQQERTNLPAIVEQRQIVPLRDLGSTKDTRNTIATNFTGVGPVAAAFITQALAKDPQRLDDMDSDVFMAKYYLCHVAEVVTKTGEVIETPRVVLIGPNMETLAFLSEGAIASLDLIRTLCGDDPWDPPLPISVVEVKTRMGFRTYRLVLGMPTDETQNDPVRRRRGE